MFLEERRRAILDELRQHGRVSVTSLSDRLHVSAVTIRQDLRMLESEGLLDRTHGGAVLRDASTAIPHELAFSTRQQHRRDEKQAIGRTAAGMVSNGYALALDASTTALAIVPFLKLVDDLVIVTNSLIIAQQFLDTPRIHVQMPAGTVRSDSVSLVGRPETLPDINLMLGFFGTHGLTLENGITEISMEEVVIKQAMIARCRQAVIVADSHKWNKVAPYTFELPQNVDRIITDEGTPAKMIKEFQEAGIEVDVVSIDR